MPAVESGSVAIGYLYAVNMQGRAPGQCRGREMIDKSSGAAEVYLYSMCSIQSVCFSPSPRQWVTISRTASLSDDHSAGYCP